VAQETFDTDPFTQLSIGTLIGALVAGFVADVIGRRWSVTFWCVIFSVGNIVMISAEHHWYQIMMGRFVAGLGVGALSLLVPMYMGKLSTTREMLSAR
jgi:MFS transporter, SP family, sugar:H+ symporter